MIVIYHFVVLRIIDVNFPRVDTNNGPENESQQGPEGWDYSVNDKRTVFPVKIVDMESKLVVEIDIIVRLIPLTESSELRARYVRDRTEFEAIDND
jgi:hypothetical protein